MFHSETVKCIIVMHRAAEEREVEELALWVVADVSVTHNAMPGLDLLLQPSAIASLPLAVQRR
jgi:hypothetical protein